MKMATFPTNSSVLREWAPLTDLFNKLPTRLQNGIFNQEVKLTCVDVLPDFIALGTNLGVVYWYDRKKKDLQRLRCENIGSTTTVVKVISTVDYMLACGNKDGNISIFQIPKSHPDNLPESLKPKSKQVERYTVADMHKGAISAIEWSKNGMKLFSGDKNGLVVLTEIDFYMHICKSVEILNEAYEVVQLSYHQQNLLISTMFRSIICQKQDKWKVTQVGKKDRKLLGKFGAIFYPNGVRPNDVVLYCTRPGLRIWVADNEGCVQQTLLFKDILNKQCPEVPLINPISNSLKKLKPANEASFGVLLTYKDFIVTYSSDVVYILNPKDLSIVSTVSNLRGILAVATNKEEIFVLEEERSLIRLAHQPECFNDEEVFTSEMEVEEFMSDTFAVKYFEGSNSFSVKSFQYVNVDDKESYSIPSASTFAPLSSSIRELTNKIHTSAIISAIPPFGSPLPNSFNIHTDVTSIISAEEATESPVRRALKPPTSEATSEMKLVGNELDRNKRMEILNEIAKEEFDDTILFRHRRRKKLNNNMTNSVGSLSSNSSDEVDSSISRPTLMNLSTVSGLPDPRSPDTILSDIEQKEKMLADILNFDQVKINLDDLKECENETESKLDEIEIRQQQNVSETQNSSGDLSDSTEDDDQSTTHSPTQVDIVPKHFDVAVAPAVINIPNEWNLSQVKLSTAKDKSESDNSLGDWEIV